MIEANISFYDAFAPLGVLAKLAGIFPARDIFRGPYLRREWYTFCIFPTVKLVENLLVYWDDPENYDIYIRFGTVLECTRTLEFYNQLVSSVLQYILMQVYFRKICAVFQQVTQFDAKVDSNVNGQGRHTSLLLSAACGFYMAQYMLECYLSDKNYLYSWQYQLGVLLHTLCTTIIIIPIFLVVFMSEAIRRRFISLSNSMRDVIDCLPKTFEDTGSGDCADTIIQVDPPANCVDRMCYFCGAFDELSDVVSNVSEALGPSLSLGLLSLLFDIIMLVSILVMANSYWVNNVEEMLKVLVEVVVSVVVIVSSTLILARISTQAAKSLSRLQRVRTVYLDQYTKEVVLQLTQRMSSRSFNITGARLFAVDRNLIPAIAATATTYIIVLGQFKQGEN